jgi:hypothetical protein
MVDDRSGIRRAAPNTSARRTLSDQRSTPCARGFGQRHRPLILDRESFLSVDGERHTRSPAERRADRDRAVSTADPPAGQGGDRPSTSR